ncbi:MAG: protein phosphatase 2C domain-containing protein [Halioglobus sp.]
MESLDTRPWRAYHNRQLRGSGWSAYGESRKGSNRACNEDNYILAPLAHDRLLVAVADGLGGHNAGRIASRLACETLYDSAHNGTLDRIDDSGGSVLQALEAVIQDAHQRIAMWSKDIAAFEGMGCTLTAAVIAMHRAWYCHVGDSRLYQISDTSCLKITEDHIATNGALLTQALGIEEKHNHLEIQQGAIPLRDSDALLLCSDGLYRRLAESRVADIVRSEGSIVTRVQTLICASLEAGSSDDITAVMVAMTAQSRTV